MKQSYNKLVRYKIPNIIKNNGGEPYTRILSNDEYIENLKKKTCIISRKSMLTRIKVSLVNH